MRFLSALAVTLFCSAAIAQPVNVGTGAQMRPSASRPTGLTPGDALAWFGTDGAFHFYNGSSDAVMRAFAIGSTITGSTTGSVLFVDATNKLGQGNLLFDPAAQTLTLGDGNGGGAIATLGVDITNSSSGPGTTPLLALSNRATGGYADMQFVANGVVQGQIGAADGAAGLTYLQNSLYVLPDSAFVVGDNGHRVLTITTDNSGASGNVMIGQNTADVGSKLYVATGRVRFGGGLLELDNGAAAAVSASARGAIRYDNTRHTFGASVNGGTYEDIITGGQTSTTITLDRDLVPHDSNGLGTHQSLGTATNPWAESYISLIEAASGDSLVLYGDGLQGVTLATNGAGGPSANFADTIDYSVDQHTHTDLSTKNGTSLLRYSETWAQAHRTGAGGFVELGTGGSVAVGASGTARLRFDGTNLQQSLNGGAYSTVGGAATVITDSPLSGDGSSGSHVACSGCTTAANTQTFTNKSMSGGTNTFSAIPESAITNLATDLAAKAPSTRNISTSGVASGGGDLSADRTISIRINASGGLVGNLGAGTNELGIGALGVADSMIASGITASKITGAVANATNAVSFSGSLVGVVSGTQGATTIAAGNVTDTMLATGITASKISGAVASATTAVSFSGSLSGDVTGGQGSTVVGALQGFAVSNATPSGTMVLQWNTGTSKWTPTTLSAGSGNVSATPSAIGDMLYSTSGTAAMSVLADMAAGSFLRSGGVASAPAWSTITLPNAFTTGDLLSASATNTGAAIAAVATGSVLVSAGTGTLPAYSATLPTSIKANGINTAADVAVITRSAADTNGAVISTTPKLLLTNSTAATVGAQKFSPEIEQCSNGWKTTATAGSQAVCSGVDTQPIQSTTNPVVSRVWYTSTNAGTRTARMQMLWPNTGTVTYLLGGAQTTVPASNAGSGGIGMDSTGGLQLLSGSGGNTNLQFANNAFDPLAAYTVLLGHGGLAFSSIGVRNIESWSTIPTCTIGTGAGTGATCAMTTSSTDMAGRVTVNTGTTPAASGATIVTITAAAGSYTAAAFCVIDDGDPVTTAARVAGQYAPNHGAGATTTILAIKNNGTGLAASTTGAIVVDYVCLGGNN